MSRPYSIDEKNWLCVCMQQRKSQKTRLRKRRGRTYSSFWSSMALRGSLRKTERLLLPKIYLWFRMMRSYSRSHCLAPAYIRDPRLGTLCTQSGADAPTAQLFITFRGSIHRASAEHWEQKKCYIKGCTVKEGPCPGTGSDREKQTLPESPNEERDASAFLSALICSKCYWWHPREPLSSQCWSEGCPTEQVQPCPSAFGQPDSFKEDQQFIFALKTPVKSSQQAAFGYICCHVAFGKCSVCNCRGAVLLTAHSHHILHTQHASPVHAEEHRHTAGSSIVLTCCWMNSDHIITSPLPWFKLLL